MDGGRVQPEKKQCDGKSPAQKCFWMFHGRVQCAHVTGARDDGGRQSMADRLVLSLQPRAVVFWTVAAGRVLDAREDVDPMKKCGCCQMAHRPLQQLASRHAHPLQGQGFSGTTRRHGAGRGRSLDLQKGISRVRAQCVHIIDQCRPRHPSLGLFTVAMPEFSFSRNNQDTARSPWVILRTA